MRISLLATFLFSKARLDESENESVLAILAPLAVVPEAQGRGCWRKAHRGRVAAIVRLKRGLGIRARASELLPQTWV